MRFDPDTIAEAFIARMMIDHHQGAKTGQFRAVFTQPLGIATIKADEEKIILGLGHELPGLGHIGLDLPATGEKPIEVRDGFFKVPKHLFAHAFENLSQPEQRTQGVTVGVEMGGQENMSLALNGSKNRLVRTVHCSAPSRSAETRCQYDPPLH